ncbi:T9SS type A sorting domain-containing protein [Hymenobacter busanensis]|nr:T9SS type A sorting domain-containing protein [Hymenobacter busanensis]QHJ08062.1 T9SS type A sorting domain-containing protein [Hymenobacter busanensis]
MFIGNIFRLSPANVRGFLCILVLLVGGNGSAWAQAPVWQTATAIDHTGGNSIVRASAADAFGNVYLVGDFNGTAAFGTTTLISSGTKDAFVAKWSATAGRFVWALKGGGAGFDQALAVAITGSDVYVAGSFSNSAQFGGPNLSSAGGTDVFVAKIGDTGSTGRFIWTQRAGGTDDDYAAGIAASGSNVYLAGSFASSAAAFGSLSLTNAGSGSYDVFVVKLEDGGSTGNSGRFVWAGRAGGTGIDQAAGLALQGSDLYVAGSFSSPTAGFGGTTLSNAGSTNAFVTKLTDGGTSAVFRWAQRGGTADATGTAVAVDGTNVYVAGYFSSASADFGNTTLLNANTDGSSDVFVAKLTDAGSTSTFTWAERAGGVSSDAVDAVAVNGSAVYVAGSFQGAARFGTTNLSNTGATDLFVARLTDAGSTGSFGWAVRAGGTTFDFAHGLAVNGTDVYVSGSVGLPARFGNFTVSGTGAPIIGYVAQLSDLVPLATEPSAALAGLGLYPNPAHARTTVQIPPVPGAGQATLLLFDALGRTVLTQLVRLSAGGAAADVPLLGLAPGIYRLQVRAGNQRLTRSLAIE